MVIDSISNLIIKIKNASFAKKETVVVPHSSLIESVLEVLQKNGFIASFSKKGKKVVKSIEVSLAYEDGMPKVQGVDRISKLSRRVYKGAKEIKPVRNGFGLLVLSTPAGVLSGDDAKAKGVGGEVLFKIW